MTSLTDTTPETAPDNTHLDVQDRALAVRIAAALAIRVRFSPNLPLDGDVIVLADGTRERVAAVRNLGTKRKPNWHVQPSRSSVGTASVHVTESGATSFSGGLRSGYSLDALTLTPEAAVGTFWMWHHGIAGGGRGVDVHLPVRVWTVTA